MQQVKDLAVQVAAVQVHIKGPEARLTLNSKNCSKPSINDRLSKPASKSLRLSGQHPVGGQKNHIGHILRQSAHVDAIVHHWSAPFCAVCQQELQLSQTSAQAFCQQAQKVLAPTVQAIGQAVQGAGLVHADETGIWVQGKLHWRHCAITTTLTWLGRHAKCGTQAFEALGILGACKGTLCTMGWPVIKASIGARSLCNAHHLRELTGVHEQERIWDPWTQGMIDLLVQANKEAALTGISIAFSAIDSGFYNSMASALG